MVIYNKFRDSKAAHTHCMTKAMEDSVSFYEISVQ